MPRSALEPERALASEEALRLLEFDRVRELLAVRTASEAGARRARAVRPGADLTRVRRALAALGEAQALVERQGPWPPPPSEDAAPVLARAAGEHRLGVEELGIVADLLAAIERTHDWWREHGAGAATAAGSARALVPEPELRRRLDRALDREEGRLHDRASPELSRLRGRGRALRRRLRERLERLVAPGGGLAEAGEGGVVTLRDERYVVTVRADRFDRGRGVVQGSSSSGATLFVEPFEVLAENNELRELQDREDEEVRRLLDELGAAVAERSESLGAGAEALAELDLLSARVRLARALGATPPAVEAGGGLRLRSARHPLLWLQAGGESAPEEAARAVVPFDLDLEPPTRVLVISGPNMGGKTVVLKSVGLAAAMAQSGLAIAAAEGARLPWFEEIRLDLGDAQSLDDHLSTFAARLQRIDGMVREAGERSLCLLDELGTGTDPEEGAALGQAVLERLAERGAWTVATTHLGALKLLAADSPEVENASLEIDLEAWKPLYRLQVGIPGGSHGLAMARRLGFEEPVVRRAEGALSREAVELERVLEALAEELRRARSLRRELERRRAQAESEQGERERREAEAIEARREKERRRWDELRLLEGQARSLLRELRREHARRETPPTAEALRSLAERTRELERRGDAWKAAAAPAPAPGPPGPVRVGDEVVHGGLGLRARVVEGPGEDGAVVLARGAWRIQARLEDLRRLEPARDEKGSRAHAPGYLLEREGEEAPWEIDLRGRYPEEALAALDQALDRAVLAGHRELRIIHGVGSGALRRAVERHLADHPQVRDQRLGAHGEGGRGVTLAEIA